MLNRARTHITYANVVATLALVFAMSGGALAAKHYLIDSTNQISPKVLSALKGKAGPTGPEGLNGAAGQAGPKGEAGPQGSPGPGGSTGPAGAAGAAGGTGPSGPKGATGTAGAAGVGTTGATGQSGATGATGPTGPVNLSPLIEELGNSVKVAPGKAATSFAECPTGTAPVSGGFDLYGPPPSGEANEAFEYEEEGKFYKGWLFWVENPSTTENEEIEAIAYCAGEGEAVAPAVRANRVSPAARKQRIAAALAKRRAEREARRAG